MANVALQISVLKRLFRRQIAAGTLTEDDLLAKAAGAGAVIEEGVEVIIVQFEGGSTQGVLTYPKEIVMQAALDLLDEMDPANPLAGTAPNVVHQDFSYTRVES